MIGALHETKKVMEGLKSEQFHRDWFVTIRLLAGSWRDLYN